MAENAKIRKIDNLGRLYIPQSLRRACGWEEDTPLVIGTDGEAVALRRWDPDAGDAS